MARLIGRRGESGHRAVFAAFAAALARLIGARRGAAQRSGEAG